MHVCFQEVKDIKGKIHFQGNKTGDSSLRLYTL